VVVNRSPDTVSSLVVHQPADHPYVRHLGSYGEHYGNQPLQRPPQRPPAVWDVPALRAHGTAIVHLHFGFEHLSPDQVGRWVADLDDAGIALVFTVHDLDNPHLIDQRDFHRSLHALVGAAAEVMTLTPAAAAVIEHRHRRRATVVPHPHVVPMDRLQPVAGAASRSRSGVYVHAATVRPNLDVGLLGALADAAERHGGLYVHVRDTAPAVERVRIERLRERGAAVEVASRLTDDELWMRIASARLVVLPYRWGTHSGLLEAARDLGTPTLAPGFGGYQDQGAHHLDPTGLAQCMQEARDRPPRVTAADRRRQRDDAAELHRLVYDRLGGGWS